MKILLISPDNDNQYGRGVSAANKYRMITPLLGLPYLAALTPQDVEVKIIDEAHGLMTEFEEADLVGITGMTMHAERMYRIADRYRDKGIPVVLGGIHVSYMPEEAANHADSVVIGEADEVWPQLIEDFRLNRLKSVYRNESRPDIKNLPFPRLDLVQGPRYEMPSGSINSIMATRGCPHNCSFCCVSTMFGRKFRIRPIGSIISEIERMNNDPILFADDNLIGNPHYAKELFKALKPLNRVWGGQMSIQIGHNPELLDLAVSGGLKTVFVGFESVNPNSLKSVNKDRLNSVEKYSEAIKRLHDKGVKIFGSFIVGLDHDDESVFEQIYEFVVKMNIEYPLIGILTPFPGTRLYQELEDQGRIFDRDWRKYNLINVVFKPKKMTPEKLQGEYEKLLRALFRQQMAQQLNTNKYRINYF